MYSIYIAGSLFTEAEQEQRRQEQKMLEAHLDDEKLIVEVFNPINNPFNDKTTKPTAHSIFKGDSDQIRASTHILINLDNPLDAGVFVELGQAYEMGKKLYPVISDMRMPTAGDYEGEEVPFGVNQYVIGLFRDLGIERVFTSANDAINALVDDLVDSRVNFSYEIGEEILILGEKTTYYMGDNTTDIVQQKKTATVTAINAEGAYIKFKED